MVQRGQTFFQRPKHRNRTPPRMASGILDSSLKFHLANAKKHSVTQEEIAEIITHAAFYAGWSKVWAAFNMAKEVCKEN